MYGNGTLFSYRWLGVIMESLGSVVVLFAALFAILNRNDLSPGSAALSVSYALTVRIDFMM